MTPPACKVCKQWSCTCGKFGPMRRVITTERLAGALGGHDGEATKEARLPL